MTISAPIQRGVKRPLVGVLVLPEGNIKQGASAYGMNIVTALSLFIFLLVVWLWFPFLAFFAEICGFVISKTS